VPRLRFERFIFQLVPGQMARVRLRAMAGTAVRRTGVTSHDRWNDRSVDEERMREIFGFTARSLKTARPTPFGASIVKTKTGERLMRATNAVTRQNDPSSHGELRTVRLACKKLRTTSLAGYTMYSTCEPCAMCMANALWAKLDRVVYGATIEDASQHCLQIHIPAKEVARRSDMKTIVEGPVLRELCATLFEHPNMQKAIRRWSSRKETRGKS
jgi:tRNA(adenine34) deaminase